MGFFYQNCNGCPDEDHPSKRSTAANAGILHPTASPCTTCKDICPYGEEIFSRPSLVKD